MVTGLGDRIKVLREARGMTQDDLARAVGRKSKSAVCNWESGASSPPTGLLGELAAALGVTVGELFGETKPDTVGEAA